MKTQIIAILALILSFSFASAQEKIIIGGSGSLNEEVTDLAKIYMAKHPGDSVEVRPESMSTEGGLEGVRGGRFHIGLISRPLNPNEKGKLVYLAVARSMAGVVIHKSLPITNLSDAQICDIFGGKIKSWKELGGNEAKITVLTRKRDDNNTETFRNRMPCFKDLVITSDAIALLRGNEVLDALEKRPGTVGITNLGSNFRDHENIKAVAINGVSPTAETARNEKYRFFSERGLVTLGEPQGLSKRFIEFMATAEGRKIIGSQGAIPVR
ncbi:MAG TPA: substrate-binding domain-containing protein [Candidatus Binatia bacterium]